MTPAQLAVSMAALGGSRVVMPAAALPLASTDSPVPAAIQPAADASTVPATASLGLSASVLHPNMLPPQQAGAVPWEQVIAECGLGRAALQAGGPQPAAGEIDPFGWNAIITELGLGHMARPGAHEQGPAQSNSAGNGAEAANWGDIIAETGLGRAAYPPSNSLGRDPSWASLAADVAAERPGNL